MMRVFHRATIAPVPAVLVLAGFLLGPPVAGGAAAGEGSGQPPDCSQLPCDSLPEPRDAYLLQESGYRPELGPGPRRIQAGRAFDRIAGAIESDPSLDLDRLQRLLLLYRDLIRENDGVPGQVLESLREIGTRAVGDPLFLARKLAEAEEWSGNLEEEAAALEEILASRPGDCRAAVDLVQVRTRLATRESIEEPVAARRFEEALASLAAINETCLELLAHYRLLRGTWTSPAFRTRMDRLSGDLLREKPFPRERVRILARGFEALGDDVASLALRARLRRPPGEEVEDVLAYAKALQHAGRFEEAAVELESLLETVPERTDLYRDLALLYFRAGRRQKALETAERGLAAGTPHDFELRRLVELLRDEER